MASLYLFWSVWRLLACLVLNPTLPLVYEEARRDAPKPVAAPSKLPAGVITGGVGLIASAAVLQRAAVRPVKRAPPLRPAPPPPKPKPPPPKPKPPTTQLVPAVVGHRVPLPLLTSTLAAMATVRGMLLPFALLVASERSGWRTLTARAASSVVLGAVAAGFSATRALRAALVAALLASVWGLVGGLTDSLRVLTASTFVSTLSYAALPLAQTVALVGTFSATDVARRFGLLSAIDALASAAGVQASLAGLSTARWADGGPPAVLLSATAAAIAVAGNAALPMLRGDPNARPAPSKSGGAVTTGGDELRRAARIGASVLALAAAVTLPSLLLQRAAEMLPRAPSAFDRVLDGVTRLVAQAWLAPLLVAHNWHDLGPKGATMVGCAMIAIAGSASLLLEGAAGAAAGQLRRLLHHAMTMGLYLTETTATTLVALAAVGQGTPALATARCAISLVLLHTGVTLGPALLPIAGWSSWPSRWAEMLLPLVLVALVPSWNVARSSKQREEEGEA